MDTTAGTLEGSPAADAGTDLIDTLPSSFRWGMASSAYQIEGAVDEDGRSATGTPTAGYRMPCTRARTVTWRATHHRMPQDVELIHSLGVDTYRFSVAWPRVQPRGEGPVNPAASRSTTGWWTSCSARASTRGSRCTTGTCRRNWRTRAAGRQGTPRTGSPTTRAVMFDHLGDRVLTWTTLNEPWCSAMLGYAYGRQAPGREDFGAGIHAVHHLLLGHGLAVARLRSAAQTPIDMGITLNIGRAELATDSRGADAVARRADGLGVRCTWIPWYAGMSGGMVEDSPHRASRSRYETTT